MSVQGLVQSDQEFTNLTVNRILTAGKLSADKIEVNNLVVDGMPYIPADVFLDYSVGPVGSNATFTTITEAVAAAEAAGASEFNIITIYVYPGRYAENITLTQGYIYLTSFPLTNSGNVVINKYQQNSVTINGSLTVQYATTPTTSDWLTTVITGFNIGEVVITDSSNVLLKNCMVLDTYTAQNDALGSATCIVSNCVFGSQTFPCTCSILTTTHQISVIFIDCELKIYLIMKKSSIGVYSSNLVINSFTATSLDTCYLYSYRNTSCTFFGTLDISKLYCIFYDSMVNGGTITVTNPFLCFSSNITFTELKLNAKLQCFNCISTIANINNGTTDGANMVLFFKNTTATIVTGQIYSNFTIINSVLERADLTFNGADIYVYNSSILFNAESSFVFSNYTGSNDIQFINTLLSQDNAATASLLTFNSADMRIYFINCTIINQLSDFININDNSVILYYNGDGIAFFGNKSVQGADLTTLALTGSQLFP